MNELNKKIEKHMTKIIAVIILSQPFIDVVVGFSNQINLYTSFTSLIRIFILFFLVYYAFFISKNKFKKRIIFILLIILSYFIIHLFIINNFLIYDLKMMIRVFYFPIAFLFLFLIKEEDSEIINQKHLLYSLGIYAFIIIFGCLTKSSFSSYREAKLGTAGYFYAANEISNIIAILLPLVFGYLFNNINFKRIIYFILIISAIFILGTKTPFISLVLCLIYFLFKSINRQNIVKTTLISTIVLIILALGISFTPIYKNTTIHLSFLKLDSIKQIIKDKDTFDHFVLGSRLKFLKENAYLFNNSSLLEKLFGLGYTNQPKLVEMDYHDLLYRQGIIGFLLYFMLVFYTFFYFKKRYKKEYLVSVSFALVIAGMVGHVITAPAVSFFVACVLCMYSKECSNEGKRNCSCV